MILYKLVTILPKIYQSKRIHTFSVSKKHFALVQCILVQCDAFTKEKLQSFEMFEVYQNRCSQKCRKIHWKTAMSECPWRPATLLKERLRPKHFLVNFVTFLRAPVFYRTLRLLLVYLGPIKTSVSKISPKQLLDGIT